MPPNNAGTTPEPSPTLPDNPAAPPAGPTPPAAPAPQPAAAPVVGEPVVDQIDIKAEEALRQASPPKSPMDPAKRKKLIIGGGIAAALLLALLAFYFGYYNNPSVVYSQSLKNTSKGYDKLVTYVDKQSAIDYKGLAGTGTYTYQSGDSKNQGNLSFASGDDSAEFKVSFGSGPTTVNADVRALKSSGASPDIYFKVDGLVGLLGAQAAMPEMQGIVNSVNNNWIVVDHSLLDGLQKSATGQTAANDSLKMPGREQVLDEMKSFGQVNQEYLFTTDKDKAVMKVVKKLGTEKIDGRKTFRYQMALNKDNVKKYLTAQRQALTANKLGAWLKANDLDQDVNAALQAMEASTKDIKDTDTFELWTDAGRKMIYKVRFSDDKNPAANFVDIGLDYKGGDSYPLFISGNFDASGQKGTGAFVATLNTKSNSLGLKLSFGQPGSSQGYFVADANLKPTNAQVNVERPANAKPLETMLNEIGLGAQYQAYLQQLQAASNAALPATGSTPTVQ